MYTVSLLLKSCLLLKGKFSKFLEELLFGTYRACVRFLNRVAKRIHFCYFTQKWFCHRRSPSNWKFSEQTKEILVVDSLFCIVIGGWIAEFKLFKRNATKGVFLIILQNFHNSSFSNILSKMYENIFIEAFSESNGFMHLLNSQI